MRNINLDREREMGREKIESQTEIETGKSRERYMEKATERQEEKSTVREK